MRNRIAAAALSLAALTAAGCWRDHVRVPDMKLGRVVIYRNGVAYFERHAMLDQDRLSLSVPRDKVDDFLKSLTVRDARTGQPMPVSFPSPGSERNGMIDMVIELPHNQATEVVLTYLTESPAWKPSYRVFVGNDGTVQLQGLAIVDNTSGEDWKDVLVGVGSSSALSFRYDLWSVRQVFRQTLASEDRFAVAPPSGASPHTVGTVGTTITELADDDIPRPADHPEGGRWGEKGIAFSESTLENQYVVDGVNTTGLSHGSVSAPAPEPPPRGASRKPSKVEKERAKELEQTRQREIARQAQSRQNVAQLAEKLRSANHTVVIEGYARTGEADAEARALDRANVLRNQLIEQGVPPGNLKVKGVGVQEGRPAGVRLVLEGAPDAAGRDPSLDDRGPVGESHFDSPTPMSIDRGASVMVSIVDARTAGKVVYLYDADSPRGNDRFAFKAIRMVNPTSNALESGPVTVYGRGKFIGEGLTDPIPPEAVALVPFALDRQIVVDRKRDGSDRISKMVSLSRGVLTAEVQHLRRTSVTLTNRMRRRATVYVRHTVQDGWTLVDGPKNRERLGDSHLFAVDLGPRKSRTIDIEEATPLTRTLDLRSPAALDLVQVYLTDSARDPRLAESMKKLLAVHSEIAAQQQAIDTTRANLEDYRARMDELHAQIVTLKAVKSGGSLMRHLRKKLEEVSERVQQSTLDLVARQEKLMTARIEFQNAVSELTLAGSEVAVRR